MWHWFVVLPVLYCFTTQLLLCESLHCDRLPLFGAQRISGENKRAEVSLELRLSTATPSRHQPWQHLKGTSTAQWKQAQELSPAGIALQGQNDFNDRGWASCYTIATCHLRCTGLCPSLRTTQHRSQQGHLQEHRQRGLGLQSGQAPHHQQKHHP